MNLLFITDSVYPKLNANSQIAYNLASAMHKECGCEITILGVGTFVKEDIVMLETGIRQETLYENSKLASILSNDHGLAKVKNIIVSGSVWGGTLKRIALGRDGMLLRRIDELCEKHNIDIVIVFSNPTSLLETMIKYKNKRPFVSYKLDPWSTHYKHTSNPHEAEQEKKSDEKASEIIVTDLIYNDYYKKIECNFGQKIHTVEFPNLFDRSSYNRPKTENCKDITCVFTGALYEDIRNPQFTLDLFSKLADCGVTLHIYGPLIGTCFNDTLPSNVVYHGVVDSEESLEKMGEADVLVNIGNTIYNQMPSKLITYIAYGKPILNIVKSDKCPTLKYADKYPLALNVVEKENVSDEAVAAVKDFLLEKNGKLIDFDTIRQIYLDCTPEKVAKKVYEILQNINA